MHFALREPRLGRQGASVEAEIEFGELTDDAIAGDWRIWQRRRGHRYSLDDVATAWEAASLMPSARRYCDLGCGIGSVLLMVSYKLQPKIIAAVEAQDISHAMVDKNLRRNGMRERVTLIHGDLRDSHLPERLHHQAYDLITGTPPYMYPHEGSPSTDSQRTYARLEMRGGIEAYQAAARPLLAPDGRFVVCCSTRAPERALEGAEAAQLRPVRKRDVVPRAGKKGALFTVWTFARSEDWAMPYVEEAPLVARDEQGTRTEISYQMREFFDLPVNRAEPASPGKKQT